MLLKLQPNRWSCLLTSFEMALGTVIDVGHDGSEVIWKNLQEPYCRRGFHIQEMIDAAWRLGYCCVPVEPSPASQPIPSESPFIIPFDREARFESYITGRIAVMEGIVKNNQNRHAIAWDGNTIFDPSGNKLTFTNYQIETCWLICKDIC